MSPSKGNPTRPPCCTASGALAWLEAVTEAALDGDEDLARLVGHVADHAVLCGAFMRKAAA